MIVVEVVIASHPEDPDPALRAAPLTVRVPDSPDSRIDPFTWRSATKYARSVLKRGFWSDRDGATRQYWPRHRIVSAVVKKDAS